MLFDLSKKITKRQWAEILLLDKTFIGSGSPGQEFTPSRIGVYHASEVEWIPLNLEALTELQARQLVTATLNLLTPVTDLLLSKRAENCLLRSEIYYRGQLRICQRFHERGLGVKSIMEILAAAKNQWNEDLPYLRRLGRERYGLGFI